MKRTDSAFGVSNTSVCFGLWLVVMSFATPLTAQEIEWKAAEPIIKEIPVLPTDPGHQSVAADFKKLTAELRARRGQSTTEGASPNRPLFDLPLRKAITNPNPGFFALSNYVDQDMDAPDSLLDWNCGERTYDLEDGDNHNGVDYFNWPWSWLTMEEEGTVAVAAADGMIVQKRDGEPDKNCVFNDDLQANQVVLEHDDGSISLYAHFKNGTVTTKAVGDTVERGDYLGVIGSSGFSNGPHLHFGVFDSDGHLIEPHAGECNMLNDESWWMQQEEYYEPGINLVATHDDVPVLDPPCPESETPNLRDSFEPGESVIFSVVLRDLVQGEPVTFEVLDPTGTPIIPLAPYEYPEPHAAGIILHYPPIQIPANALSGAYTWRVSYAGQTREHTWYVNSGPDDPPVALVFNNAYNGLWYDPGLDGEGYNFVTAGAGTVIYFYGSDKFGNRLWLISDLILGNFGTGIEIVVTMFESTGGTFASPVASARALSVWGTLTIEFEDCNHAVATLDGIDGFKVSQIVKLAGVPGTLCDFGDPTGDSPWSGLWFDLGDEGEGYNLIVAPNGAILYFYGFKANGSRLWLISDLIVEALEIDKDVEAPIYEATQGDFDNPVPSNEALVQWGTVTIRLVDCNHITITIEGSDGSKVSATVRLAGVIGVECAS